MGITVYNDFEYFCESFEIKYVENGFFSGSDWKYENIKAPYNRLYIVLNGEAIIFTQAEDFTIQEGYAYLVPAELNFSCSTPVFMEKLYAHFLIDVPFSDNIFGSYGQILSQKINVETFSTYKKLLNNNQFSDFYPIKGSYNALIYNFISQIDIAYLTPNNRLLSPLLKKLYQLVEGSLSAKLRTSDLAKQLGISQSVLSKSYKASTGQTLKYYLQSKLMYKSQILLLTTKLTIQEIAYQLGYDDALYFSRVFKETIGVAPTLYRKKNRDYHE